VNPVSDDQHVARWMFAPNLRQAVTRPRQQLIERFAIFETIRPVVRAPQIIGAVSDPPW
jgi:hypothetical protein